MNLDLIIKVLKLRQAALRVTAGKLTRGLDATRDDSRLYDMHSYYSAHTGRYAGRLLNVHNLPRGVKVDVDAFLRSNRDLAAIDAEATRLGVSADEVIASLIRPCLMGSPALARCDYSAIEPRVLAWLAGEDRMLNIYRAGQQPYIDMGKQLYGRTISKKDDLAEYNVCKAVVIGCVAKGTRLRTDSGFKAIEDVELIDRVWDGSAYVQHAGVKFQGWKLCLKLDGLSITPDHEVLTEVGFLPAGLLLNTPRWNREINSADGRLHIASRGISGGTSGSNANVNVALLVELINGIFDRDDLPDAIRVLRNEAVKLSSIAQKYRDPWRAVLSIACRVLYLDALTRKTYISNTMVNEVLESTRRGSPIGTSFLNICVHWMATTIRNLKSIDEIMTGTTNRATCDLLLGENNVSIPVDLVATYDVIDAGPNTRYQAGNEIVHNCGYGLSHYKLGPYCKAMGVDLGDLDPAVVIKTYRDTYAKIPRFWRNLDHGTKLAVRTGQDFSLERLYIYMEGDCLCIRLPSGRSLRYRSARIEMEIPAYARFLSVDVGEKPALKYTGPRGDKTLYGGLLAENVTQAVARDLLGHALVRCEAAGLNPVLHVHDEIVCETVDLEALERIMSQPPDWALDLPIAVEGVLGERFGK